MRIAWLREEERSCRETLQHDSKGGVSHLNDGTYLPFKRVWDEEGQDEAGFEAMTL